MAVNYARASETEEKKYNHNVAITVVFDSIYSRFYFTTKGEVKGPTMLTYGI